MTDTATSPGDAPASRARWGTSVPPSRTCHVTTKDMTIEWDRSQIRVAAGTLVHAEPGSELWHAYGGKDGLRPAHGGTQAGTPDTNQPAVREFR